MVFIFTENEVNNCFSIYHTSELQVISRLDNWLQNLPQKLQGRFVVLQL